MPPTSGAHGSIYPKRRAARLRKKCDGHLQAASIPPPIAHMTPGASLCPSGNQGATVTCGSLESRNGSTGLSREFVNHTLGVTASRVGRSTPVIYKQRRCGSMKRMMYLGALVLSVTVCSQSFGFELLDRMLGHKGGASCCDSCCEPGCDAGNGCCEPGCDAGNGCCEPACDAGNGCCEPACDAGNGCCDSCCGSSCCGARKCRKHDLFGGLKGLFEKCKRKHRSCCGSCCEPACDAGNGCCEPACDAGNGCCEPACDAGCCNKGCCEPACDAGNGCCEPACDAGKGCCEPSCCAASCCGTCCRKKCTPIRDLLKALHAAKKCRKSCCGTSCCEPGCDAGCCEPACDAGNGCCEPACDAGNGCCEPACNAAPDCSASISKPVTVAQVSRMVVAK